MTIAVDFDGTIVEHRYPNIGKDRAKYVDRLLKRLAESVNKRGINETLLKVSRAFYLNYPQIGNYLQGKGATASHQFTTSAVGSASKFER